MNQFKNQTKLNINDIIKDLPHRYPFILIDRIENDQITFRNGSTTVTRNVGN